AAEERPAAAADPATPPSARRAPLRRTAAPDPRSAGGRALRTALAAYARDDYVDAARQLTKLARAGNAEAQHSLGFLYAQGKGVLGNLGDAIVWYRRAAEQGHVEAQY